MLEVVATIIFSIAIIMFAFSIIVVIPLIVGKLLFRWSGRRVRYVFSESMSTIVVAVVVSLLFTGFVLLVGIVFEQQWAFSGGLLVVYTFWIAIKSVWKNIRDSEGL